MQSGYFGLGQVLSQAFQTPYLNPYLSDLNEMAPIGKENAISLFDWSEPNFLSKFVLG